MQAGRLIARAGHKQPRACDTDKLVQWREAGAHRIFLLPNEGLCGDIPAGTTVAASTPFGQSSIYIHSRMFLSVHTKSGAVVYKDLGSLAAVFTFGPPLEEGYWFSPAHPASSPLKPRQTPTSQQKM